MSIPTISPKLSSTDLVHKKMAPLPFTADFLAHLEPGYLATLLPRNRHPENSPADPSMPSDAFAQPVIVLTTGHNLHIFKEIEVATVKVSFPSGVCKLTSY